MLRTSSTMTSMSLTGATVLSRLLCAVAASSLSGLACRRGGPGWQGHERHEGPRVSSSHFRHPCHSSVGLFLILQAALAHVADHGEHDALQPLQPLSNAWVQGRIADTEQGGLGGGWRRRED